MAFETLFSLVGVTLQRTRLRGVSVTVRRGVTAVLGWSGAGKTSLLNVLAGFETAEIGSVTGEKAVAWVPQRDGLWPGCTAREHLTECGASVAEAEGMLGAFDLGHLAGVKPGKLSRGEQARLAVARALAMPARTLIFDEPLAHVDPARVGRYWRVIREQVARTGVSLVFATHAAEFALAEAEQAIALHEGTVVYEGTLGALYYEPGTEELAMLLGPVNWLTGEEAKAWLGLEWLRARGLRAERVGILEDAAGAAEVVASRFFGGYAETELRRTDGVRRVFFHRPVEALGPGTRVRVKLLG